MQSASDTWKAIDKAGGPETLIVQVDGKLLALSRTWALISRRGKGSLVPG
jgi:hypothetical protein